MGVSITDGTAYVGAAAATVVQFGARYPGEYGCSVSTPMRETTPATSAQVREGRRRAQRLRLGKAAANGRDLNREQHYLDYLGFLWDSGKGDDGPSGWASGGLGNGFNCEH